MQAALEEGGVSFFDDLRESGIRAPKRATAY
jgi:hypothetical protein